MPRRQPTTPLKLIKMSLQQRFLMDQTNSTASMKTQLKDGSGSSSRMLRTLLSNLSQQRLRLSQARTTLSLDILESLLLLMISTNLSIRHPLRSDVIILQITLIFLIRLGNSELDLSPLIFYQRWSLYLGFIIMKMKKLIRNSLWTWTGTPTPNPR